MEKYTTSIDLGITIEDENLDENLQENAEAVAKPRTRSRAEKKQKKVKRAGAGFYFINILIGVAIAVVLFIVLSITFFKLKNIEYEGIANSNAVEIESRLFGDKYSNNTIYSWIINQVRNPGEIPFVNKVDVYLKNPTTIVVSVKEDPIAGYIESNDDKYIYFDQSGKVVEISRKYVANIPRVEGVKLDEQLDGEDLNTDISKKNAICELLKYLKDINITPKKIVFDRDNTYGFYVNNIFVDLGISTNLRDKVSRLSYVIPSLEGRSGTVHMEEWSRENSDIVFEENSLD